MKCHCRNNSDASSNASSSKGHIILTPSITSESPCTLKGRYENERNLAAEESTISLACISEQRLGEELSQTESESIHRQTLQPHRGNMYTTNNMELTNSSYSSVQGSHQSLPNGPHYSQRYHGSHNYSDHQITSPSLSSSAIGGGGNCEVGIITIPAGSNNNVAKLILV